MLTLLHIDSTRPGPKPGTSPGSSSGSTGPAAPNYDEALANPVPLPDPLRMADGRQVRTAKEWYAKRRPELLELFSREVYGRVPSDVPAVHWEVVSTAAGEVGGVAEVTQRLLGRVDNSADPAIEVNIEAAVTLPAAVHGRVPIVMELTFDDYPQPPGRNRPVVPPQPGPTWKEQVLDRGWGYALLYPTTVQPDNGAGLARGIIGLANHGQPRTPDQWGALRAWAWGASRLLDYLGTDAQVDARRVAISGHSRFGKAALVAMAFDQRFAVAYVNSSGAGGAAPARRHYGEQLENVAGPGEYHWMAGNYLKYAGPLTPADLPVDSDDLIALCAPRPVFIGGGTTPGGDGWADVRGSFLAEAAASPVYRLLGVQGLGTDVFPPVGTLLDTGHLAFRQHPGGHTPLPDYPYFLDFAARTLNAPGGRR